MFGLWNAQLGSDTFYLPTGLSCKSLPAIIFYEHSLIKNSIELFHLRIYADIKLYKQWSEEYAEHSKRKLDMGKNCVRLKYLDEIPYDFYQTM